MVASAETEFADGIRAVLLARTRLQRNEHVGASVLRWGVADEPDTGSATSLLPHFEGPSIVDEMERTWRDAGAADCDPPKGAGAEEAELASEVLPRGTEVGLGSDRPSPAGLRMDTLLDGTESEDGDDERQGGGACQGAGAPGVPGEEVVMRVTAVASSVSVTLHVVDRRTGGGPDAVQPFSLDPTFDYDNVTLTPKHIFST